MKVISAFGFRRHVEFVVHYQKNIYPHTVRTSLAFLANANPRSRSLYAVARPSVVCNVRAPYSAGRNFRQYFYVIWYLGHPLTSTENFTDIVPGEPLRQGF